MRSVKVRTRQTCPDCGRMTTWHCVIAEQSDGYGYRRSFRQEATCTFQRDESACQCEWTLNAEQWESERVAEDLLVAS